MTEQQFRLTEGTSDKFWKIRLEGNKFTVHFGRVGTAGQVQTKEFASDAEAKLQHDKLLAEKVKKGYMPFDDGAPMPAAVEPKSAQSNVTKLNPAATPTPSNFQASAGHNTSTLSSQATPIDGALKVTSIHSAAPTIEAQAAIAVLAPPEKPVGQPAPAKEPLLQFTAEEWDVAHWGPREHPRPRPHAKPFDLERCITNLFMMNKGPEHWSEDWERTKLNPFDWSLEEAHFWLVALSSAQTMAYEKMDRFRRVAAFEDADPTKLRAKLTRSIFTGQLSQAEAEQIVTSTRGRREHFFWVVYPLVRLLPPVEYLSLCLNRLESLNPETVWAFDDYVVQHCIQEELHPVRNFVREHLPQQNYDPKSSLGSPPMLYLAASMLGMKHELHEIIKRWPDGCFDGEYSTTLPKVVLGLCDGKLILQEMQRLKLHSLFMNDLYRWLACTGEEGIDWAYKAAEFAISDRMTGGREKTRQYFHILKKVVCEESAEYLWDFCLKHSLIDEVREWSCEHAIGLKVLCNRALQHNRRAEPYRRLVRDLAKRYEAEKCPAVLVEALEEMGRPNYDGNGGSSRDKEQDWLQQALNMVQTKKTKKPEWLTEVMYEPMMVDGWLMTPAQTEIVLTALQQSTASSAHQLIDTLRTQCDRQCFDQFLWDIFSRWVDSGAPPKDKWAMLAMGMLGSEKLINRFVPMLGEWRESGFHQRAQVGLECLRQYGTDYALMRIHEISQTPKLKSLRNKALEYMDEIAAARGMTKSELEDRIVPTCDLDDSGSRIFDFGPRRFFFVFGNELKPMVRDEKGAVKADLPAATQKDDAALAKKSIEEWKELKKILKTVGKIQSRRLEESMVTCRSWTRSEFETLLLNHPLMTNLIRRSVWGGLDESGKVVKTFRVMEDKTLSDETDRKADLEGVTRAIILHPLNMSDEQRSKWGEIFSDYEIMPLFPQLGRPIYTLTPDEEQKKEIVRFAKTSLPSVSVPGTLERLGWLRGPAEDNGVYSWHHKQFRVSNISAVAYYPGIPMGMMVDFDDQEIERLVFVNGIFKDYPSTGEITLNQVPPIVVSEALYDLTILTAQGKEEED